MGLRILSAGGTAEERERAEAVARAAIGSVPRDEKWQVSLVRLAASWSITLDAPGRHVSQVLDSEDTLRDTILGFLNRRSADPVGFSATDASLERKQERRSCRSCGQDFAITYEARPDEPRANASVACPYCWKVDQFEIPESAVIERSYTADRLG